jgi:MIP family channel proteins
LKEKRLESIGRASVAEFVATFGLVFIGAGTGMMIGGDTAGLIGVALAHGIVLAVLVSVTGHISGGMANPAVTIGLWVTGKLETGRTLVYIVVQLAGAVAAALLLKLVIPETFYQAGFGGTPLVNSTLGIDTGKAVLIEAILTFLLVFAVFGTAVDDRRPFSNTAGLTIGLVLTFDILMGGLLTGASMNPARTFGPGFVSGTWTDWWVYWVGPIAGSIIAAVLYWTAFLKGKEPATP